ncbi:MAG: citrate/2-methylcitrate synthase [Bacillota bacterium]
MQAAKLKTFGKDDVLFQNLSALALENNKIDPSLYTKYNVKRGLRNSNGTGVLVGLTEISYVYSYILEGNKKTPVEGRLYYRGYDVFDLVRDFQEDKRFGFEETCYLLLFGELPDKETLAAFKDLLGKNRELPNGFTEDMILKAPSNNIMNKLARSVLAAYCYDDTADDLDVSNNLRQAIELIARFPTMVAHGYAAKKRYFDNESLHIHSPRADLSTAENLLYMVRPHCDYTALEAEILDLALVLHAEHGGGNNSSFATHVVSSTGTDIYSAIAAAVGALKGWKHGGANIKVIEMMSDIQKNLRDWENEEEVASYLTKILNKEAFDKTGLIYGIGHAVYTYSDPRTILLKQKAAELAKEKGLEKEYKLYELIEKLAPAVFAQNKESDKIICANVDFYSGFVYKALNIPPDLYTPIFAVARIVGWCAHRLEELVSGGKVIRPAYKDVSERRPYVPIKDRNEIDCVNF